MTVATLAQHFQALPAHPTSWPGSRSGFYGNISGDLMVHAATGQACRLDEALHDGEAYVTMYDGSYRTFNWGELRPLAAQE